MTVDELKDYLTSISDHGKGSCNVYVCDKDSNPMTECWDIVGAVQIDKMNDEYYVVLQN